MNLCLKCPLIAVLLMHSPAMAVLVQWHDYDVEKPGVPMCASTTPSSCDNQNGDTGGYMPANCDGNNYTCVQYTGINAYLSGFPVRSCTKCGAGYQLRTMWFADANCYAIYSYCQSCTSNESACDTAYKSYSTGYERKAKSWACDKGCYDDVQYRCAQNYYGNPTTSATGCTACPSSGGIAGKTKSAGSTSSTSCYIPASSALDDVSGSYTFTSDCYWTN